MSLLSTVFKVPTKAQIGFLKLDASFKENHTRTATVTDNEVEDGSIISDHIRLNPKSFTIEGVVSDTPISILGLGVSSDDILGAADSFLDGDENAFEGLVKNETRTPKEAWGYLEKLLENRTPFSAVTSLQRYENMVITSLSAPRAAENGKDLMFSAELRMIEIVESSTTKVAAFKVEDDSKNSASSKNKLGKQATKGATDAQTDSSSILLQGFKKVGIF